VSASHEEGWGLPPAEAAACGAALVVSENGGHYDFLSDGQTALMFKPHDVEGMKAAIRSLAEDGDRRNALARAAHTHIQSYNWARSVDILEGYLSEAGTINSAQA
jgi:glycosyltransferase involved in cell wall biosynthesis